MGKYCKLKKCETCFMGICFFITGAVLLGLGCQPVETYQKGDLCDDPYGWDLIQCEIGKEKSWDGEKKLYFKVFGPISLILGLVLMIIPIVMWVTKCGDDGCCSYGDDDDELSIGELNRLTSERIRQEERNRSFETSNTERLDDLLAAYETSLPSSHHERRSSSPMVTPSAPLPSSSTPSAPPQATGGRGSVPERRVQPGQLYNDQPPGYDQLLHPPTYWEALELEGHFDEGGADTEENEDGDTTV
ncbi:uncharacterized protein [Clytia hemisphaerica]|uniref:uncharacterized protein n=1 Tax=Clytia hemisphaerica TaxID=252671 RepID=UPI0034D4EDBC